MKHQRNTILVLTIFLLTFIATSEGASQTNTDNPKPKRKTLEELDRSVGVSGLRDGWNPTLAERKLKPSDQELLAPDPEEVRKYAEFLKQPNTGLFKLLNADRVILSTDQLVPQPLYKRYRGGGSYYSYGKRRHDVDDWAQIKQLKHAFHSGTAAVHWRVEAEEAVAFRRTKIYGQSLALFLLLGDVPLNAVTLKRDEVHELASLAIPTDRKGFKSKVKLSEDGFKAGKYTISSSVPTQTETTYLQRSVIFKKVDVLVAFRVVREDPDGTLHILWKEIRREGN